VHIGRQQVDLVVALDVALGRHLALATVADGLLQLGEARTVDERLRVGQVRRAHGRGALALGAVAGHAVGGEDLLALGGIGLDPLGQAATVQVGQDKGGDVGHALFADHLGPGRHHAVATVHDRGLDGLRLAAPTPVVVGEVGEAVGATGIGAVADRAVGGGQ